MPEPAPSFEREGTTRAEDDELEYETIANEEDGDENRIDSEDDRDYTHAMVRRTIQALYTSRIFLGEITWYNAKMEEFKVSFNDCSDDYMGLKDIDGVKVFLR